MRGATRGRSGCGSAGNARPASEEKRQPGQERRARASRLSGDDSARQHGETPRPGGYAGRRIPRKRGCSELVHPASRHSPCRTGRPGGIPTDPSHTNSLREIREIRFIPGSRGPRLARTGSSPRPGTWRMHPPTYSTANLGGYGSAPPSRCEGWSAGGRSGFQKTRTVDGTTRRSATFSHPISPVPSRESFRPARTADASPSRCSERRIPTLQ